MSEKRVYRIPLERDWVRSLLHQPSERIPEAVRGVLSRDTIDEFLSVAQSLLGDAVEEARGALKAHPFADTVAREMARRKGKRGSPSLVVEPDGSVVLEVRYRGSGAPITKESQDDEDNDDESEKRKWTSRLPSLEELRQKAQEQQIDISGCGRSKKKIIALLKDGGNQASTTPSPRKKMVKTAPAISPPVVLEMPPKSSPEPATSMAELASQAEEDVDSIIASLSDDSSD